MQKQGVVFDFNGTLFWDTKLQNDSWDSFLRNYGLSLNEEQKNKYIHGINAKDTFEYLFKRDMGAEEVDRLTEEKEVIYRQMCLDEGMEFAPGAEELIRFLIENDVEIAIATASAQNNVEFFIEHFHLLRYFKRAHIIFNDGTLRGKPHPDLFTKAIKAIGTKPEVTTIFEDSHAGLEAAKRAGAGNIIIVNSTNTVYPGFHYRQISHFNKLDRSIFLR